LTQIKDKIDNLLAAWILWREFATRHRGMNSGADALFDADEPVLDARSRAAIGFLS